MISILQWTYHHSQDDKYKFHSYTDESSLKEIRSGILDKNYWETILVDEVINGNS